MSEHGAAPAHIDQAAEITITHANGQYNCKPPSVGIPNGGQVDFNDSTQACWVYTDPADAFVGEKPGGYLELSQGHNQHTVNSKYDDTVIGYCACDVNPVTPCTPGQGQKVLQAGGTIKVGNPPDETAR